MAFVDSEDTISKVPVDGGPPLKILRLEAITGSLSWADDNTITFSTFDPSTGLLRVSANGGEVEVLTRPDHAQNEVDHTGAFVLPTGRGVLFAIVRGAGGSDIAVLDLKTCALDEKRHRNRVPEPQANELMNAGASGNSGW